MANVAKYNREEVLEKAMILFWERGYHATSTRELQQVTNMRPGSFYAAFGSKEGLFKEVLERYAGRTDSFFNAKLEAETDVVSGLKAFVEGIVLEMRRASPSEFCLVVKTVAELSDLQPDLLEQGRNILTNLELKIVAALKRAQQQGEIKPDENISFLAQKVMVQVIGLRSYIRNSLDEVAVQKMIDEFFADLRALN